RISCVAARILFPGAGIRRMRDLRWRRRGSGGGGLWNCRFRRGRCLLTVVDVGFGFGSAVAGVSVDDARVSGLDRRCGLSGGSVGGRLCGSSEEVLVFQWIDLI